MCSTNISRKHFLDNYAAAFQTLKFNACQEPEISQTESSRIFLVFKYLNNKLLTGEFTPTLLKKNLSECSQHLPAEPLDIQKNCDNKSTPRLKFKSGLGEGSNTTLIDFIEPLPCTKNGAESCIDHIFGNNHIKKIVNVHFAEKEPPQIERAEAPSPLYNKRKSWLNTSKSPPCHSAAKVQKLQQPEELPRSSSSGIFTSASTIQQINDKNSKENRLKRKDSVNNKFVCPIKRENKRCDVEIKAEGETKEPCEDERLKNIDEKMIELIRNEIMDGGATVDWEDVAGLAQVKKVIKEIVVFPMLRPDIFTGLRRPPKGILLFGPPGTGKTLIGKCVASQSKSTFFSISASSLTSKWVGEGEKMVRALFAVAKVHQPSVVFIDEIDSLLTQRSETEHESSRRIKTEFLVQLDGATTGEDDRVLVIGATNRPQELDEAARRRFVKRLYIPLPERNAREQIVENLLRNERNDLTQDDVEEIAGLTKDYSGADMANLCKEASMGPIRSIPFDELENIKKENVRCVTLQDFKQAITLVRPSVSQADLSLYITWDQTFGSGTAGNG